MFGEISHTSSLEFGATDGNPAGSGAEEIANVAPQRLRKLHEGPDRG